jgi:hypothetical protein
MKNLTKLLFIAFMLTSCSAHYHMRKMFEKDPDILKVEARTETSTIPTPIITQRLDFESLVRNGVTLITPRAYIIKGEPVIDTVKTVASINDDGEVELAIDCPDVKIVESFIPEPYPVYVEPSFIRKVLYVFGGIIIIVCLIHLYEKICS